MSQRFTLQAPDSVDSWTEHPEDWQFEDPLVSVSKDGEVRKKELFARPKVTPPKMRSISEILGKEDDGMDFIKLDMDKQVRMVAEAYSKGLGPSATQEKLGIKGAGTYYDRLRRAKEMGLVKVQEKQAPVVPKEAIQTPAVAKSATADNFAKVAEDKLAQAERLAREAQRLQQAGKIAIAVEELLGDKAGRVVATLYEAINI